MVLQRWRVSYVHSSQCTSKAALALAPFPTVVAYSILGLPRVVSSSSSFVGSEDVINFVKII